MFALAPFNLKKEDFYEVPLGQHHCICVEML